MKISIVTLFPEIFSPILSSSILGRALKKGLLRIKYINLRDFGDGPHLKVDDKSYGGGVGLVLKADILGKAVDSISRDKNSKVILTSASGNLYNQRVARKFSKIDHLILICGHYEGVDERFIEKYVDEEISIGDFVLTGGEIPAMLIVDSVVRLIPGVLEKEEATLLESFENNLLEYPQYTKPQNFDGLEIPEVLLSGNHQKVEKWRQEKSLEKTKKVRPDLLKNY